MVNADSVARLSIRQSGSVKNGIDPVDQVNFHEAAPSMKAGLYFRHLVDCQ
jgi:hypothetical protein